MRVLVVGAGGVGGYFGGRLQEAGGDVTFLVRPRRGAQLASDGLVIKSPRGDVTLSPKTVLAGEITKPWDLVILSCKAYSLAGAMTDAAPAIGEDTMILPLLNGMAHLDQLEARFGARAVLGGLCTIAATLDETGAVLHMSDFHNLAFGERDGSESDRIKAVAALFAPVSFHARLSTDIIQEMWEKWVFLSVLAGATCLFRASVGDIAQAGATPAVLALWDEVRAIAQAASHPPRPQSLEGTRALLTDANSTLTASMMRDLERGGEVEADHILGDLVRRAGRAGVKVPMLNLCYRHLLAYEARRKRQAPGK